MSASFLGLPFAQLDLPQAAAAIASASQGDRWRTVVTPNAAHLARLSQGDATLLTAYADADLCLLDSRVIALAARLTGLAAPPVVPGSDLVEHLFAHVITPDATLCIIGGDASAIARLRTRYHLGSVSHVDPSRGFWRDPAETARLVDFIVGSQADYTFLVVGSPQQEMLALRVAETGAARGVGLCAGASLDFLTGVQRRAPRLMQRLALEWAYRLCRQPRRMAHRYLIESPRALRLVLRASRATAAVTAAGSSSAPP